MPGQKAASCGNRPVLDEARIRELILLAKEASEKAYCPYSKFRVGASVLAASGKVYSGCNVENAAFGDTICAERGAIMQMVRGGDQEIDAVVIYTPTQTVSTPCGSCRQVINEFCPNARIISACDSDDRIDIPLVGLLPAAFGPRNLA
jgi:cytidine deaminase